MEQQAYEALQRSGVLQSITWQKGLLAVAVLLGSFLVAKFLAYLVRRALGKRGSGIGFALSKLLIYCLVVAGFLTALGVLGLPVASLLLTSTALLVGLGFSLQHIARDFVSGIVILSERSILKNDFITFGETIGTVQEIGLRSTQVLTRDGTMLVVPNHLLTVTEVSNHTSPIRRARLKVDLPVGFREKPDLIKEILLSVAVSNRHVLSEPPPQVAFDGILDSHFQFALIVWVNDPVLALSVASELRFAIAHAFVHRGIQFPTPAIEVHRPRNDDEGRPIKAA